MNVLRTNRQKQSKQTSDIKEKRDINFYLDIPTNLELSVDDFESLALARLKILRKIEEFKTRNLKKVEYTSQVDAILNTHLKSAVPTLGIEKSDVASHFILRAAYSRTEDLRRWFLLHETALFRHRLEKVGGNSRGTALKKMLSRCSDLTFEEVDKVEKERLRDKLLRVPIERDNVLVSPTEYHATSYFKMPFVHALELVKNRHVYLEGGYAYVPMPRLLSILTSQFRSNLSKCLVQTGNIFNNSFFEGNDPAEQRISPLLHNMNQQHTGKHYGLTDADLNDDNGIKVTAQNIDSLASNMPLCMRQVHNGLKRDHKLKYNGRLQYILFLKGAGMTMEETLLFLQYEFTKIMSIENFTKQYSYSVRHLHGKEGKRSSKASYSCSKIILGQPPQGPTEHHGCPFKHYDTNNLSNLLSSLNINDRDSILDLTKQKNYQLACQKHFEVTHSNIRSLNVNLDGVGNHPNAWFHASLGYRKAIEEMSGGKIDNTAASSLMST